MGKLCNVILLVLTVICINNVERVGICGKDAQIPQPSKGCRQHSRWVSALIYIITFKCKKECGF